MLFNLLIVITLLSFMFLKMISSRKGYYLSASLCLIYHADMKTLTLPPTGLTKMLYKN